MMVNMKIVKVLDLIIWDTCCSTSRAFPKLKASGRACLPKQPGIRALAIKQPFLHFGFLYVPDQDFFFTFWISTRVEMFL